MLKKEQKIKPKIVLENAQKKEGCGLTYDDVLVIPGHAEVMPKDVKLETRFSKNLPLKIPIVSAAMEITECELAIGLAKEGGIGIIHQNLSPVSQAYQVAKVKGHLKGCVETPETFYEDETLEQILNKIREEGFKYSNFPILDRESKLVGILTEDCFKFSDDNSQKTGDIMIPKKELAIGNKTTNKEDAYKTMQKKRQSILPLIDENGELAGMYVFSGLKSILEGAETYNLDRKYQLRVGAAITVYDFERLEELVKVDVDVVVIDTAHGDSKPVYETLRKIKEEHPDLDVVAGNVSTKDSIKRMKDAGADGVKVGQGCGSICIARVISGAGYPQLSAIYQCAKEAEKYDFPICADGGLSFSGDITKAIAAGADSVMMGGMLAGVDETPGKIIFHAGRQWKDYRGMGSLSAMREHQSSRKRYRQEDKSEEDLIAEGVEGLEPYKGPLRKVIKQYIGGLRQGMGYAGAATIKELRQNGDFIGVTKAGVKESHVHGVLMTEEPLNYPGPPGKEAK